VHLTGNHDVSAIALIQIFVIRDCSVRLIFCSDVPRKCWLNLTGKNISVDPNLIELTKLRQRK
jgi:hypothetical protein